MLKKQNEELIFENKALKRRSEQIEESSKVASYYFALLAKSLATA